MLHDLPQFLGSTSESGLIRSLAVDDFSSESTIYFEIDKQLGVSRCEHESGMTRAVAPHVRGRV
jgi:hypothetical protein